MLLLAIIYYQERNFEKSEKIAQKIIENVPKYVDAWLVLIRAKIATKQFQQALELAQKAKQIAPKDVLIDNLIDTIKKDTKATFPLVKKEKTITPSKEKTLTTYKEMAALRQAGKISLAKEQAINYLKVKPDDVDVRLLLGLIYYQEKQYSAANESAQAVLRKVPSYIDARVLLVNTLLATNNFLEARTILDVGLSKKPNDSQLKELSTKVDNIIKAQKLPKTSLIIAVEKCQEIKDSYTKPLLDIAKCYFKYRQYYLAARIAQDSLAIDSTNKQAKGILSDTGEPSKKYLAGLNEVGFFSENNWISDLHEVWTYSKYYYTRHTRIGDITPQVNYAQRRGVEGYQEEILLTPILSKRARIELDSAFSSREELFPRYLTRLELYYNIPHFAEISLGECYNDLTFTHYSYTTGTITKETSNFYISLRPYHYVTASSKKSTLFLLNSRLFINKDNDHYIWSTIGYGTSPDLNDLLTVNFITIKNEIYYLGYHFPVCNNKIAFTIAADYQRQVFPTGRVRRLTGAILGISVRF